MYEYQATVVRVLDGDTVELLIDTGFNGFRKEHIRLNRIDAPEKRGASKEAGLAAKAALEELLPPNAPVIVKTHKFPKRPDTLERYLGDITVLHGTNTLDASAYMVDAGHAVYKSYK